MLCVISGTKSNSIYKITATKKRKHIKMPKIISEETAKKAKELRKQGLTFDQISQELDISKTW